MNSSSLRESLVSNRRSSLAEGAGGYGSIPVDGPSSSPSSSRPAERPGRPSSILRWPFSATRRRIPHPSSPAMIGGRRRGRAGSSPGDEEPTEIMESLESLANDLRRTSASTSWRRNNQRWSDRRSQTSVRASKDMRGFQESIKRHPAAAFGFQTFEAYVADAAAGDSNDRAGHGLRRRSSAREKSRERLLRIFEALDVDKDGLVDKDDMLKATEIYSRSLFEQRMKRCHYFIAKMLLNDLLCRTDRQTDSGGDSDEERGGKRLSGVQEEQEEDGREEEKKARPRGEDAAAAAAAAAESDDDERQKIIQLSRQRIRDLEASASEASSSASSSAAAGSLSSSSGSVDKYTKVTLCRILFDGFAAVKGCPGVVLDADLFGATRDTQLVVKLWTQASPMAGGASALLPSAPAPWSQRLRKYEDFQKTLLGKWGELRAEVAGFIDSTFSRQLDLAAAEESIFGPNGGDIECVERIRQGDSWSAKIGALRLRLGEALGGAQALEGGGGGSRAAPVPPPGGGGVESAAAVATAAAEVSAALRNCPPNEGAAAELAETLTGTAKDSSSGAVATGPSEMASDWSPWQFHGEADGGAAVVVVQDEYSESSIASQRSRLSAAPSPLPSPSRRSSAASTARRRSRVGRRAARKARMVGSRPHERSRLALYIAGELDYCLEARIRRVHRPSAARGLGRFGDWGVPINLRADTLSFSGPAGVSSEGKTTGGGGGGSSSSSSSSSNGGGGGGISSGGSSSGGSSSGSAPISAIPPQLRHGNRASAARSIPDDDFRGRGERRNEQAMVSPWQFSFADQQAHDRADEWKEGPPSSGLPKADDGSRGDATPGESKLGFPGSDSIGGNGGGGTAASGRSSKSSVSTETRPSSGTGGKGSGDGASKVALQEWAACWMRHGAFTQWGDAGFSNPLRLTPAADEELDRIAEGGGAGNYTRSAALAVWSPWSAGSSRKRRRFRPFMAQVAAARAAFSIPPSKPNNNQYLAGDGLPGPGFAVDMHGGEIDTSFSSGGGGDAGHGKTDDDEADNHNAQGSHGQVIDDTAAAKHRCSEGWPRSLVSPRVRGCDRLDDVMTQAVAAIADQFYNHIEDHARKWFVVAEGPASTEEAVEGTNGGQVSSRASAHQRPQLLTRFSSTGSHRGEPPPTPVLTSEPSMVGTNGGDAAHESAALPKPPLLVPSSSSGTATAAAGSLPPPLSLRPGLASTPEGFMFAQGHYFTLQLSLLSPGHRDEFGMLQDQHTALRLLSAPGALRFVFDGRGYRHRPCIVAHPGPRWTVHLGRRVVVPTTAGSGAEAETSSHRGGSNRGLSNDDGDYPAGHEYEGSGTRLLTLGFRCAMFNLALNEGRKGRDSWLQCDINRLGYAAFRREAATFYALHEARLVASPGPVRPGGRWRGTYSVMKAHLDAIQHGVDDGSLVARYKDDGGSLLFQERPIETLMLLDEMTRWMQGGTRINCKSAKDRSNLLLSLLKARYVVRTIGCRSERNTQNEALILRIARDVMWNGAGRQVAEVQVGAPVFKLKPDVIAHALYAKLYDNEGELGRRRDLCCEGGGCGGCGGGGCCGGPSCGGGCSGCSGGSSYYCCSRVRGWCRACVEFQRAAGVST